MEPDPDEHLHPGEEGLEWEDESIKENKPKGLYSKTSEKARGFISTERQCALFCGGKKCKYCTGDGWEDNEKVIKGLYSHWVTDNILAMARPSNQAIEKHKLVEQFVEKDIRSIVNLQIAGEHADCGPHKLDPSGFLYNPQAFMEKGVFFYNFGWPDYGVASLSTILDMVKVMQFAVSQGKVAVHCHAGRGRTGVIIACYLVFTNRITGREAIHYIREKRPQSIQTRQQMQVIQEFEQYLQPFRTVYASRQKGSHEFTLQQFLNRQRHILHGYEARRLKYVPKIVYTVCERMLELAKKGSSLQKQLEKAAQRSTTDLRKTFSTVSKNSTLSPSPVKQSVSKDSVTTISSKRKKPGLRALRNRMRSISMEDLADDKYSSVLKHADADIGSVASSNSASMLDDDEDDDNNSIVFGNSATDLRNLPEPGSSKMKYNCDSSSQTGTMSWSVDQSINTNDMSEDCVQTVAYALSADTIDKYVRERVEEYEEQLNSGDSAWLSLATEGDPHVLGLLLWDWLDQLKEPVLRAQDLNCILHYVTDPTTGLQKLEKGTKFTIEYLVKVISKLRPMKEATLLNIYEKLLSHLTHQWVVYDDTSGSSSWAGSTREVIVESEKEHWSDMKEDIAEKLFNFFHNLQREVESKHRVKSGNFS
ncbi:protein tyrosine phosphatase domain-containing protein 1-like isoform X2 [Mya arenaria]|uniref:protein tyrosine phosphatase domain-containing protein 1-like isoform X2 n=1 Tax=Mya arenaria TaxID=6604 RepID=UPI0022E97119|nr:protein tyrosine phosphatase domain-containing protein 1-like isoform X2 [Mya arenaria]